METKEIYTTQVRIDLDILRNVIAELRIAYDKIDPTGAKATNPARSAFTKWNTVRAFYDRNDNGKSSVVIPVVGHVSGSSHRIYNTPSLTSLCKEFRKCVVPLVEGNKFMFFDIKAAEFFMAAVFSQEVEAVAAYQRGEDIYMSYAHHFPQGSSRELIKNVMISNLYGVSDYRVALNAGITETQAKRLLLKIQKAIPRMEAMKVMNIMYSSRTQAYWCPNGFDQTNLQKVNDVDPSVGFKPLLALSAYIQSALGLWMQNFVLRMIKKTPGTVITVFDSCLFEVGPSSVGKATEWVNQAIVPFRTGSITVGDSFYEAAGY